MNSVDKSEEIITWAKIMNPVMIPTKKSLKSMIITNTKQNKDIKPRSNKITEQ
jgi:hypothetical protein